MSFVLRISALTLVAAGVLAWGQSQSQQPQPPDPTAQAPATHAPPARQSSNHNAAPAASADQYVGEIILANGKYFLRSGDAQYKLDDQAKVKQFAGQTVQVTGTLDDKNLLHVSQIKVH
ncbi:MAG TPA: DUF5818 domain-containing protein [Terriglobales bacterium]|nr:DUF5818 domain-containing protein [Terriglobales bacterium]